MELINFEVLQNPEKHIIETGGYSFMAKYKNEIAGTVALKFAQPGIYEFTKMVVDEKFQGKGIGKRLALAAQQKAKQLHTSKITLYSNTKLAAAINQYRTLGFIEVLLDGPYKHSNIKMELALKD